MVKPGSYKSWRVAYILIATSDENPALALASNALTRQVPLAAKTAGRPRLLGASRPYINSNRRSNQALAADAA